MALDWEGPASRSGVVAPRHRAWPARHPAGHRGTHDVRRSLAHPHHGNEGAGDHGVLGGNSAERAQVGIDCTHGARGVAVDLGRERSPQVRTLLGALSPPEIAASRFRLEAAPSLGKGRVAREL
jgi:hypothetical protein